MIAFHILVVVVGAYAWLRGGAPERVTGCMFVSALIATDLARTIGPGHFRQVEFGIAVIDVALVVGVAVVALRADRTWPIWCVAWLIIASMGHLAKGLMPEFLRPAYQMIVSLSAWPTMYLLARGTCNHQKRLHLHGADPCWSRSSRSIAETSPQS